MPARGMSMSSGAMSSGGHGITNILPSWLALIWALVFVAIFIVHARHARASTGQRRLWHSGHVLMSLGMVFMYVASWTDRLATPSRFWQFVFALGALLIVAWTLGQAINRRAVNVLWLLMAIDLAAMVYMWSPSGLRAPVTWLLVSYLAGQSLLWASDRMRSVDRHALRGGFSVTPEGAVGTAVAEPLVCYRDLRASMCAMTLGMAYMFAAMQLLM